SESVTAALATQAAAPDIVLQGMAETRDGDDVQRTAIIRAGNDLVLATLGTAVGGRYRVAGLTADSVELDDVQGGPRRTVRLQ
ncbi:MAG: hypothetical protein NTY02_17000, partial [Acidobacteria bacterium]|nr:hypothetical protein [Acidobacteriota bacterium]